MGPRAHGYCLPALDLDGERAPAVVTADELRRRARRLLIARARVVLSSLPTEQRG